MRIISVAELFCHTCKLLQHIEEWASLPAVSSGVSQCVVSGQDPDTQVNGKPRFPAKVNAQNTM